MRFGQAAGARGLAHCAVASCLPVLHAYACRCVGGGCRASASARAHLTCNRLPRRSAEDDTASVEDTANDATSAARDNFKKLGALLPPSKCSKL